MAKADFADGQGSNFSRFGAPQIYFGASFAQTQLEWWNKQTSPVLLWEWVNANGQLDRGKFVKTSRGPPAKNLGAFVGILSST